MERQMTSAVLRRNSRFYIVQAAVEYHISLLVTGSFLAALTTALGISDALTGVLSSVISLGCVFQLVSLLLRPRRARSFVAACSVCNQLLFAGLFLIPFLPLGTRGRIALFVVGILAAYFLYNIAHPQKVSWLMSWVADGTRGVFTANMQIVSLLSGMAFSLAMGAVCDHFREKSQENTAFVLCAAVIFLWMAVHAALLRGVTDRQLTYESRGGVLLRFGAVLREKKVRRITTLYVLWHAANYAAMPLFCAETSALIFLKGVRHS